MARTRKEGKGAPPISAHHHKNDKRANIPTRELGSFVKEEEAKPKAILYKRNPELDPQLVWRGKDEQDSQDLSVPAVPIYIQEKIAPEAIIEDIRREGHRSDPDLDLFADFNHIEFEKLVDFYKHQQNWSNRMILGDSLLVMNSLAEKEGLRGKVQMIYMDPPYGIRFDSNWQVSTRRRVVKDGKVEDATREPEQIKAFRDTWGLGIHSYLSYLRDRLVLTHQLLVESGSVFVQIGDENVHLVRSLLDEIFGRENFKAQITFKKTLPLGASGLPAISDYVLWYAKDGKRMKFRQLFLEKPVGEGTGYTWVELLDGTRRKLTPTERLDPERIPEGGRLFFASALASSGYTPSCTFDFNFEGRLFRALDKSWRTTPEGIKKLITANRLIAPGGLPCFVTFHTDFRVQPLHNLWNDTHGATDMRYVVETSKKVIERCLLMSSDPGDLVLDPTCGSGTTAYVAEQWGRRWIVVDTSRVALALARTRLMAARFPHYLLADSNAGIAKEAELSGRLSTVQRIAEDIRKGFVYRRVPHVTLRSIANNPDIKAGMTRDQIDVAVARHAETEILYDQPYEEPKRVRVCGPFTVESLSPHRVLSADEGRPVSERKALGEAGPGQFVTMIIDNLRKAGVQNTVKKERLMFDSLESFAGTWLHAKGEYSENGKSKRVAVCIGPEHGTVGPELVKDAAKEAVKGAGFDLLVVCGFAFDPHVGEEGKQFGKLTVLTARMNPDLAMGDELLKKTGAGNLFMVFGEPDIDLRKTKDGTLEVEVRGVDVYDPTTGEIRSHSTDDIACWFIDTDYNEESFFVRHAYFCGADEPFEKLQRALRATVDEGAWKSLYSTKSRPFAPPKKGKIAIKVINHYGDEVLKIYDVPR